jgi:hypothetical protein
MMTFGSGLFGSTVLILLAISVWQITKHKKWKLFGKVCAGLSAVCALVVGVGYLWNYVSTRPKPVTEFEGVKLGASITDVTVTLGAPSQVDGDRLHFADKAFIADFTNDKSRKLRRLCSISDTFNLMGFDKSSTEIDIVKKLGPPSRISLSGDGLYKILNYRKWNANFSINSNHAVGGCMASEDNYFKDELTSSDLSKFDATKLVPPAPQEASINIPDTDGELADPCAPDLSKAERKRRLSKFGTIRETGLETYEAGGHRLVLSDSTVIACE